MQNYLTKRNIVIAVVIILVVAVGLWFFLSRKNTNNTSGTNNSTGGNILSRLFPTVENKTPAPPTDNQNSDQNTTPLIPQNQMVAPSSILVQESVSGAIFAGTSKAIKIRYIERATGHLFEMDPDGQNKKQISGTTIPGIFEVVWSSTGESAILKYESQSDLNILSARFTASSTQGIFLSPKIKDVAFSPKGDKIVYVAPQSADTAIIIATPDNKNQRVIYRSPFSSWRVYWPEDNYIYLANAPASSLDGFLYRLNVSTGGFEKIAGPALGLQISTNGKAILLSSSDPANQTILTSVYSFKTKTSSPTTLKIIPEKCAWSRLEANIVFCAIPLPMPLGRLPDDWYQGKVSFADIFAKINVATLSVETMQIGAPDLTNLYLAPDEKTALFINKRDSTLWKIDLTQISSKKGN